MQNFIKNLDLNWKDITPDMQHCSFYSLSISQQGEIVNDLSADLLQHRPALTFCALLWYTIS